ncbi:nucleotidyltransferase family protein [Brachybacterium saurashtrense]|uniref:2-nitropropane dioxygenase n=1 Tax=Brachybacterium saurashtrense TaxID=556288 RepID=A0A345YSH2_9MICO|nr:nucleotidyltransferase family protein [Brachybacterium saurashtrense]AXK46874.1 2-nitropropane dioxygenase [Brachybacterium saurashtrense]RRR22589.1 2-nitropropane dioxygenase [Brachybacterium saurashtrense]
MNSPVQVPATTRLRLAHGCLDHLARRAEVRVLHLKGVALDPSLAEGRAPSTDCDVLVEPYRAQQFCDVLAAHGWHRVTSFAHGSVFGHAATFHHEVWGTVDVHRSFPGLEDDPAQSFERLWRGREHTPLGGRDCPVPDLTAQRLLLLVHAARDAMGRARHDVRVSWTEVDADGRAAVEALAAELGAQVPLALATGRPERAAGGRDEHLWRAVHRRAAPSEVWRARLRDARGMRERARILLQATQVNRDHLGLRLGRPPSAREVRREWWARLGRQLRR